MNPDSKSDGIIDDAWRREDVDAFDVLGPRCRALITTRDAGLLTSLGGTHHVVELLTDAEALRLLAEAADKPLAELPTEAHQVLQHCGRLPLAVALAVFPEDEAVPEDAIATFCEQTGNLDDLDTQQLLIKLKRRSLIQVTASVTADSSSIGRVSMHDLFHDYGIRRAQSLYGKASSMDDKLLTVYQAKCSHG